ncbi:MAG: pyridoxamine 5'-phosphate oxidase family protein [Lachnospiraceae bacterium]|nr:pyridoxamine 5'-phosphate oxidase family protein [Lachnospiraceae bacterium]
MTEEQFDEAESFWTCRDEDTKKMAQDEIYQWINGFLGAHKVLALAAGTGDFIRCTPLEYSWHDDALWIFTEGGLKFKALKKNRHVAASAFDTNAAIGGLSSVQIEGTAEFPAIFSEEYVKAAEFKKIPLDMLKKLPELMWLIKIVPTEITCLNSAFKKDGYGSRQIWKKDI